VYVLSRKCESSCSIEATLWILAQITIFYGTFPLKSLVPMNGKVRVLNPTNSVDGWEHCNTNTPTSFPPPKIWNFSVKLFDGLDKRQCRCWSRIHSEAENSQDPGVGKPKPRGSCSTTLGGYHLHVSTKNPIGGLSWTRSATPTKRFISKRVWVHCLRRLTTRFFF
jgi:hypothetical protein